MSASASPSQPHEPSHTLDPDSYTAHRLQHATPEHLYLTSRRCFIGPIPEGWLKSHRREWYRRHLHIHYGSRTAAFSANALVGQQRSVAGLDAPGATEYARSFPRPDDLYEDDVHEDADEGDEWEEGEYTGEASSDTEVILDGPPAIPIPRSKPGGIDGGLERKSAVTQDGSNDAGGVPAKSDTSQIPISSTSGISRTPSSVPRPESDTTRLTVRPKGTDERRSSKASFVTARETLPSSSSESEEDLGASSKARTSETVGDRMGAFLSPRHQPSFLDTQGSSIAPTSSSTSLIKRDERDVQDIGPRPHPPGLKGILRKLKAKDGHDSAKTAAILIEDALERGSENDHTKDGMVRFDLPEGTLKDRHIKQRLAQMPHRRAFRKLRRGKTQDGEIIKMEKMLVRVERTSHEVMDDFDEAESGKIDSTTFEKWREYMVVCRASADQDSDFTLQLYKTRAIPAIEKTGVKNKTAHEIPLSRTTTKINLYSALDKTMVLWVPYERGTLIYIMQPRSSSDSMEWYTFIRNVLGFQRSTTLKISVPDLNISLQLEHPFDKLESTTHLTDAAEGDHDAIKRTIHEEDEAAKNIIHRCQDLLEQSKDYGEVVKRWDKERQLGLAWKRYDRLEWVNGQNENKMYGTMGMLKTHELELRPKQHYPTTVEDRKGRELTEPPAVEGFLIRLTSQRGVDQKLGRLFFKRLYFSTHSQFLVFNRPARADPPPPPRMPMQRNSKIPTAHQIAEKIPLIYSVNPFPVEEGEIDWLKRDHFNQEDSKMHDRDAYDESERKLNLLLKCDGNIDLTNVVKVRNVRRGATPADENIESGSDVDFDDSVEDTQQDDGTTHEFDDSRTFELILRNGLVVRLQAFNAKAKNEWKHRLHALVKYWTVRKAADITLHKSVRHENLTRLNVDEELESFIGQFARKWEVTNSFASPELYHMCGASGCRSVAMSGTLYRKPRLHASFSRTLVLLCAGTLLVFRDALRSASGAVVRHIHHERIDALDLRDCYVYSGRQTDNDVLYSARGFDVSNPDRRALPRIYNEDGWTSTDEDSATCFVVWHGRRKGWFVSDEQQGGKRAALKRVSALGVEGRSVVLKARSRAERDHWVMSIATEIERLGQVVDGKVVGGGKGGVGANAAKDKGKRRA